MNVTVVIPTKNEEGDIAKVIEEVKPYADDVVVVDGHSKDSTREIAERMGVQVILDHGLGKGDGIRTAIAQAPGDILVFIDADGSHIASDIPNLTGPIKRGEADLVIASRMTGGSEEMHVDIKEVFRLRMSAFITLIINYRFGAHVTDSQNGFRAVRKTAAQSLTLKAKKFDIEEEMLMKLLKKGYRVSEYPSRELKRKHGKSNINLWKIWYLYVWRVFSNLF